MASEQDILRELKEMGSILATTPRIMPYALPEGYFERLPQAVYAQVNIGAPTGEMPFDIPQGYFNTLPQAILAKAKQAETKTVAFTPKRKTLWTNVRWAAAAVLILTIGVSTYRIMAPEKLSVQEQLDAIPDAAIMAYVNDNIDEFDSDILESQMGNTVISTSPGMIPNEALETYIVEGL